MCGLSRVWGGLGCLTCLPPAVPAVPSFLMFVSMIQSAWLPRRGDDPLTAQEAGQFSSEDFQHYAALVPVLDCAEGGGMIPL